MPPKRKSVALDDKKRKQPRRVPQPDALKSAQMQYAANANALNSVEINNELKKLLGNQGDEMSQTGNAFVGVGESDSETLTQGIDDPLASQSMLPEVLLDSQPPVLDDEPAQQLEQAEPEEAAEQSETVEATEKISDDDCCVPQDLSICRELEIPPPPVNVLTVVLPDENQQHASSSDVVEMTAVNAPETLLETSEFKVFTLILPDEPHQPEPHEDISSCTIPMVQIPLRQEGDENDGGSCNRCASYRAKKTVEIKKHKRRIDELLQQKAQLEDHALSLSRELQDIKDQRKIPSIEFPTEAGIDITAAEIKAISDTSPTDSLFVGNLAIHFFGTERLKKMSVTGKPTPRFKTLVNADGSLVYPARDQMDPAVLKFICEKLVERVAMRLGSHKIKQIASLANETVAKKAIGQKISNLNKVAVRKNLANAGELQN